VRVTAGGSVVGSIAPGARSGEWPITLRSSDVEIGLEVAPFRAGDGRQLGTQPRKITVTPAARSLAPAAQLALLWLVPALVVALLARASGIGLSAALCLTGAVIGSAAALLLWCGTWSSPYAERVAVTLVLCAGLAWAFAALVARGAAQARPWGFAAALLAAGVQLVLAPSSLMTVSDAVFQAHNLERVARGDFFLTSATQHAIPFRIPYGVSFYALLAPLARLGLDAVTLVRVGAGVSGLLAALALFALLARRSVRLATGAVVALQVLPGTFLLHSQGNLNNIFGQAMTTLFVAWWAGGAPGGWLLGAAAFALAGLGHLSSAIVLAVLACALAFVGREDAREAGFRRGLALIVGAVVVAAYYACFGGLVANSLPRLLEGAGQGGGESLARVALEQVRGLLDGVLGLPALVLALVGWRAQDQGRLRRMLQSFMLAGAALLAIALVSPVDVRYLYALTTPVAVLAAAGFEALRSGGLVQRVVALALAALQAGLGVSLIVERLLYHYR
jgi:hypothetical protein